MTNEFYVLCIIGFIPYTKSTMFCVQIIFTNLPGSVLAVFVSHSALSGGRDYVFMAQLMSSVIFVSGLATLNQDVFGSRSNFFLNNHLT